MDKMIKAFQIDNIKFKLYDCGDGSYRTESTTTEGGEPETIHYDTKELFIDVFSDEYGESELKSWFR